MHRTLETSADIRELVDAFYAKVVEDPLIGPLFTEVAAVNFEEHLPIMYRFWESLLLGQHTYNRQAFQPHGELHLQAPLRPEHFARWLELFYATLDERFSGEVAEQAKQYSARIAATFQLKLDAMDRRAG